MFQIGDKVLYGIHGVCCVTGTEEKIIDRKAVTYLVLEPAQKDGSKYMVPTHNQNAMGKLKKMLTRQELEELFRSESVHADCWISEENQRKQVYRELIGSGDREKLMNMVCSLYRHKSAQTAAGRKCHICDENFLRDAEKLLTSEVCAVMELDVIRARQYVRDTLGAAG